MSNYTAAMIGSLTGSILVMLVLSTVFEWAIFKRVMNDPVYGKGASVFAAWLLAALFYVSGAGLGGPFGALICGAGALIILPFKIRKGMKLRQRMSDDFADEGMSSLKDTFS